ncbi:MAG: hypothetical protein ABIH76_07560 [Candidatus Bathyarchaeota archaeon]
MNKGLMPNFSEKKWEKFYRELAPDRLPWETGKPDTNLVDLVAKGIIEKGKYPCPCKTETSDRGIFTFTGATEPKGAYRYGFHVKVSSDVRCDEAVPKKCEYNYTAQAEVRKQNFRAKKTKQRKWVTDKKTRVFIQSFEIHGDINQKIKSDRIDQTSAHIGLYRSKAPQKEKTKITINLAPSTRGDKIVTLNEEVELCIPKLDNPKCPEK